MMTSVHGEKGEKRMEKQGEIVMTVTTCEKCRYRRETNDSPLQPNVIVNKGHDYFCPLLRMFVNKDWYCENGERREDASIH